MIFSSTLPSHSITHSDACLAEFNKEQSIPRVKAFVISVWGGIRHGEF
jgi:hypothetical protein